LRQPCDGCAEFDLRKETKVRVGDAIEMIRRRYSLVLACFE
jgi:ribosome-associated protein YbcJ (S4-like RNA binding protein)